MVAGVWMSYAVTWSVVLGSEELTRMGFVGWSGWGFQILVVSIGFFCFCFSIKVFCGGANMV